MLSYIKSIQVKIRSFCGCFSRAGGTLDIVWPVTDAQLGVEKGSRSAVLLGVRVAVGAHVKLVTGALDWVDTIGTCGGGILILSLNFPVQNSL